MCLITTRKRVCPVEGVIPFQAEGIRIERMAGWYPNGFERRGLKGQPEGMTVLGSSQRSERRQGLLWSCRISVAAFRKRISRTEGRPPDPAAGWENGRWRATNFTSVSPYLSRYSPA